MNDDLLKVYESMYGSKNTVEQVEHAININLRGSEIAPKSIIEAYSQANGYPKNEPAKEQKAQEHIPDEIEPAIEAPEELSPAVDSSTSKQKLTKTITDKEKKQMTSQKFSFDELYKIALKEQAEMEEPMDMGGDMGEELGGEEEMGGDEITVTLSRDAAQTLCDVLQAALGNEEQGEEEDMELDMGGSEEEGDDLEEATDMSKAPDTTSKVTSKAFGKVQDPTTANSYIGDFAKANIDPHKNVKGVKKPMPLKRKTDDQNSNL